MDQEFHFHVGLELKALISWIGNFWNSFLSFLLVIFREIKLCHFQRKSSSSKATLCVDFKCRKRDLTKEFNRCLKKNQIHPLLWKGYQKVSHTFNCGFSICFFFLRLFRFSNNLTSSAIIQKIKKRRYKKTTKSP